jgi:hypothetical protein
MQDAFIEQRFCRLAHAVASFTDGTELVAPQWLGRLTMTFTQMMAEFYYRQIRNAMMKVDKERDNMLAFSGMTE